MDYYEILNSNKNDDIVLIKKRYQELVVQHHPDKNGGNQSTAFLRIRAAWETLSNAESRKLYDAELSNLCLDQEGTVWCDLLLAQLREGEEEYTFECKCTGSYQISTEQVHDLRQEGDSEFLLGCDSCSLNILVRC